MNASKFLAEWAIRSSVLIAAGALTLVALRVKDSSIRLAVWVALLAGSLAIPLMMATLPPVHVASPVAATVVVFDNLPVAAMPPILTPLPMPQPKFDWPLAGLVLYLAVGFGMLLRVLVGFFLSRRLLRNCAATAEAGIRESDDVKSPVTLGIWRPVIVLPADWHEWENAKLAAALAHERSHIARFDPAVQLLSAVHRAALWFSPLSWFLHSRVVRVAEEASDDAAMAVGGDRTSYAGILLEFMQRGVCGAGVPMARYGRMDARIRRVLDSKTLSRGLTWRSAAAIAVLGSLLAYVAAMANPQNVPAPVAPKPGAVPRAQAQPAAVHPAVALKTPQRNSGFLAALGNVSAVTVTVTPRIDGQLMSVSFKEGQLAHAGEVIADVESPTLQARFSDAERRVQRDKEQLEEAKQKVADGLAPADVLKQLENRLAADQEFLEESVRSVGNGQVRAPITGVAGLRLSEPGNIVHPTDPIVTLVQMQPIAVLFTLPQDFLAQLRSRTGEGVGLTVQAWNRDSSAKLATGHLTAIDNQIDQQTGTVKLKATFDNKDSALFPNQFVNVRLLVQ